MSVDVDSELCSPHSGSLSVISFIVVMLLRNAVLFFHIEWVTLHA